MLLFPLYGESRIKKKIHTFPSQAFRSLDADLDVDTFEPREMISQACKRSRGEGCKRTLPHDSFSGRESIPLLVSVIPAANST